MIWKDIESGFGQIFHEIGAPDSFESVFISQVDSADGVDHFSRTAMARCYCMDILIKITFLICSNHSAMGGWSSL